jgi:RNA polymerase sigma-70 factor (ECF subfamily)
MSCRPYHGVVAGDVAVFSEHRRLLLGVAYRMLGSMADAEDVVQEAWLRWSTVDESTVVDSKSFLVTTVSRLAIDWSRKLKAQRKIYPGEWLPEPVSTEPGAGERAELADSVEFAMLVVLETLSPLERAVFVLREAFELPYSEIAEVIGREDAATRQLAKRAREHVAARRPRFEVDRQRRREVTELFLAAAVHGDLGALTDLFVSDVELVSDSGGKAKAPLRVIQGADKVGRFLSAIANEEAAQAFMASIGAAPAKEFAFEIADVNAAPALVVYADGRPINVLAFVVEQGLIKTIYLVTNPEKLGHVTNR